MTSAADRVPAPVLVLLGIVSVQFGGALAQTLIPVIGAGGSVVMRLLFATVLLLAFVRPRWRGHSRRAWRTVIAFGVALGLMNFTFYSSLAHLPIGVAVTIEFIGPLTLAAVLSRRVVDAVAISSAETSVTCFNPRVSTIVRGSPPSFQTISNTSLAIFPEIVPSAISREWRRAALLSPATRQCPCLPC